MGRKPTSRTCHHRSRAVTELDLPTLDYRDEQLTGERFRETLRELRERSWIARADPIGWFVLDQEATARFLCTKAATFPGRIVVEVQGVDSGPLYERLKGNLLDLDGEDHRRLRKLVQPAFTPKRIATLRATTRPRSSISPPSAHDSSDPRATGHYLRQFGPTGAETVAVYPSRLASNRGNAYINPLSLVGPDAARRGIVASFDCRNAGGDKPATDGPQGSPACETQKPYPFGGQLLRFPHVQREDYSKP